MRYKAIIFDMDGTILDTLEDLTDSTNYVLKQNHMPERTIDEVRSFVGNGIHRLLELAVPEGTGEALVDQIFEEFMPYYQRHCSIKTRPYPGIVETIRNLRNCGYRTAVVSNKADSAVQELCVQHFDGLFDCALGEKAGIQRKPAPDSVNATLRQLDLSRQEAVYVGDSEVDIETAVRSEMDCISVSWGFRDPEFLKSHGAQVIISRPEEIKKYC